MKSERKSPVAALFERAGFRCNVIDTLRSTASTTILRGKGFACMLEICWLTHRRLFARQLVAVSAVCVCLLARGGWASSNTASASVFWIPPPERIGRWVFCFWG